MLLMKAYLCLYGVMSLSLILLFTYGDLYQISLNVLFVLLRISLNVLFVLLRILSNIFIYVLLW